MEIPRTLLDSDYGLLLDSILEIFLAKIFIKVKRWMLRIIERTYLNTFSQCSTTRKINPFGFLKPVHSARQFSGLEKITRHWDLVHELCHPWHHIHQPFINHSTTIHQPQLLHETINKRLCISFFFTNSPKLLAFSFFLQLLFFWPRTQPPLAIAPLPSHHHFAAQNLVVLWCYFAVLLKHDRSYI